VRLRVVVVFVDVVTASLLVVAGCCWPLLASLEMTTISAESSEVGVDEEDGFWPAFGDGQVFASLGSTVTVPDEVGDVVAVDAVVEEEPDTGIVPFGVSSSALAMVSTLRVETAQTTW